MRLIDADLFMQRIESYNTLDEMDKALYNFAIHEIVCMPTVDVLDKIRDEIDRLHYHPKLDFIKNDEVVEMALDIIDKYLD